MEFYKLKEGECRLSLPKFSATEIVTWKFRVDNSTNGRYNMILGTDLLTALGIDIKLSNIIIIGGEGPYGGCSAPMSDISNYDFGSITDKTDKT